MLTGIPVILTEEDFETLHMSVLSTNGIGRLRFADDSIGVSEVFSGHEPSAIPVCLIGHCRAASGEYKSEFEQRVRRAFSTAGYFAIAMQSDDAVLSITGRSSKRATWEQYVERFNIQVAA